MSDHINTASYNGTADALDSLTDHSAENQTVDPKAGLHREADKEHAQSWISSWIPKYAVDALEATFNAYKLGNYVLDRQTGAKTFESMSIYVRLGMHLLYYGTQQQKVLHWQRTEQLLKDQSVKMGKIYDAPESVDHIQPFIDSFQLQDSLQDMKVRCGSLQFSIIVLFFRCSSIKQYASSFDLGHYP